LSEKSIENLTTSTGIRYIVLHTLVYITGWWPSHTTPPTCSINATSTGIRLYSTDALMYINLNPHATPPNTLAAACSINATSASEGATGRLGDDRQQLYAVLSRISLELLMLLVASAAMRAYCVGLYDVHHLLDVHHATSKSLCNTENGCGATGVRLERFIGMKQ